jgi:tetratricopeptide (TPR) repeat protein
MSSQIQSKSSPSKEMAQSLSLAVAAMKENRLKDAEIVCQKWLLDNPGCTHHLRLLSHSLMKQNRLEEAEERLRFAIAIEPDFPQLQEDLGSALALRGQFDEAIPHFEKAIEGEPSLSGPYKKLAQALIAVGRANEADALIRMFIDREPGKKAVAEAIQQVYDGNTEEGIKLLRRTLKADPDNVDAMRYLGAAYLKDKINLGDAEALLRRAGQIAPTYVEVLMLLGSILMERNKFADAATEFQRVTRQQPENDAAWAGLGQAHARGDRTEEAAAALGRSIELNPDVPLVQMSQGHVLKTLGKQEEALACYREAIRLKPNFGEVYWSMANLKIFRFEDEEVAAMEEQVRLGNFNESTDAHFRFALGKAWEDRKDYDRAWHYYHTANQKQRQLVQHDPVEMEIQHKQIKEVFTRDFLEKNAGHGYDVPDPIFIVGLPRSGSTLVEQVLASHSLVEGTAELPILGNISGSIGRYRPDGVVFPTALKDFRKQDWRAYGTQYIERSRAHRFTDAPLFTDKLPNNFPLIGLIHLILPNAKIINARRHPVDCCLGNYKQLWGKGQHFTYDVFELAAYYQEYHSLMKHWHEVLPGKVLDVHYEETVTDLETQVRRILEHCGLPFEEQCLRYYETDRAIRTASSEQVRQPIYKGALGRWRLYEKNLEFWIEDLAPIVEELPETVRNAGL